MRASKIPPSAAKLSSSAAPVKQAASQATQQQPQFDIGSSLFGVKSNTPSSSVNPFSSTASSTSQPSNPFANASSLAAKPPQPPSTVPEIVTTSKDLSETFASKARISTPDPDSSTPPPSVVPAGPPEPWPPITSFPKPYPLRHLDADYETLDAAQDTSVPANTRMDMDIDGEGGGSSSGGGDGGAEDKEVFESSMDRTFQRFADRLAQNPEQVLRYEFGGQPLLYARDDAVGRVLGGPHSSQHSNNHQGVRTTGSRVPRCTNCGAERVFEIQLTPHAITELEAEEALAIEGMEWGTVILMVCGRDCVVRGVREGEVGYAEEWVGVQWEEVVRHGPARGQR